MKMHKTCIDSFTAKTSRVFPFDINAFDTLFGGNLMSMIDDIASVSASRHSQHNCVTASTDNVSFFAPIHLNESVCLQSYVCYTGQTSMEIFIKVVKENMMTGDRQLAATAFMTFVAIGEDGKPTPVPTVEPVTAEQKIVCAGGADRAADRKLKVAKQRELASQLGLARPWE